MSHDVDLAILGGGCAGLSLATRLVGSGRSVTVIEPREHYVADRAWSFWAFEPHPFSDCVVKRWTKWRVQDGERATIRHGRDFCYETVDAGAFYDTCLARLAGANDVNLLTGTRARIAHASAQGVRLDLDGAENGTLHARHVIDTRPLSGEPRYGQWFIGLEIETENPCFSPDLCDLMSFGPARDSAIDFTYILPFSERHALVEATVFAARAPAQPELQTALRDAICKATGGGGYRILRREAGMVPMDATFAEVDPPPNVVPFGVRGGAARPSTGYAFARIQHCADLMAARLRQGKPPRPPRLDSAATRAMDRLFLKILRRHPELGPALFLQLFERTAEARLERFLSGSTAWRDRLAVMAALPTGLFLSHAVRP